MLRDRYTHSRTICAASKASRGSWNANFSKAWWRAMHARKAARGPWPNCGGPSPRCCGESRMDSVAIAGRCPRSCSGGSSAFGGAIGQGGDCRRWKTIYETEGTVEVPLILFQVIGGDAGIRTLDTGFGPYAPLAGECLRPLGHVSGLVRILPARRHPRPAGPEISLEKSAS
jgi:hypothetical protein